MPVSPGSTKPKITSAFLLIIFAFMQLFAGAASPQAQSGTAPKGQDIGRPRQITKNGATLIYSQPQIASSA